MKTRMNFKDEFYQKLKLLVLPIAIQNFMLALVSATDAIMLGWIDQTSLSAVSLAGQESAVLIDSKALEAAPLEVPGIAASTLGLLFVIVLPAALLAVGAVVVVLRRRK